MIWFGNLDLQDDIQILPNHQQHEKKDNKKWETETKFHYLFARLKCLPPN